MTRLKTALMLTAFASFCAQPALAITLEQTNVSVGGGRYVPAIKVTDGPGAGTYKIGEQGLTQFIIYNEAALKAWASQMAGVEVDEVKIYEPVETSDDDCIIPSSFDAGLNSGALIYVAGEKIVEIEPCYNPCFEIGLAPSSVDQLILTQIIDCGNRTNLNEDI